MTKTSLTFALAGALLATLAPMARADEWDKLTKVTFNEPVEVPGKVLVAGTYVFKLLDSPSDRTIVEIYNADQTMLEDLVLAVPDQRLRPTDKPVITFSERTAGSPEALKAWFYPGSVNGYEFVYPRERAVALAKANKEEVYSTRADISPYKSKQMKRGDPDAAKFKQTPVKKTQPNGSEQELSTDTH
jgi:hypothetical protein